MNDVILTGKMPSRNTRHSWVFSSIFSVEMVTLNVSITVQRFEILYLFYKITMAFSCFHNLVHVSVLLD